MAISRTLAKVYDGLDTARAKLGERLRNLQMGLVSGETADTDMGFDSGAIQALALSGGTLETTASPYIGTTITEDTAALNREPQYYWVQSGNGYITDMSWNSTTGVATFTVASLAASAPLVIAYLN